MLYVVTFLYQILHRSACPNMLKVVSLPSQETHILYKHFGLIPYLNKTGSDLTSGYYTTLEVVGSNPHGVTNFFTLPKSVYFYLSCSQKLSY